MNIKKLYKSDCKLFDGYKPCKYKRKNCIRCDYYTPKETMICVVALEALGAVLMTTTILQPLKRKFPKSTIYWVTDPSAIPILENNHLIDKLYAFNFDTWISLSQIQFDYIYNVDKTQKAAGFVLSLCGKKKYGFSMNSYGALIPFNKESTYSYVMGLDDELKFKQNQKTGQEILAEAFQLPYQRDEYILNLSQEQQIFLKKYREEIQLKNDDIVIGFNTGCSEIYPNKKLDIPHITKLIEWIHQDYPKIKIALFGGKTETDRNKKITEMFPFPIINTPTTMGIRTGIPVMDIADIIVTGDTFGMHMGIGLKKEMVIWYNVACSAEIDLYGRGEKILSTVECSPCWKKVCDKGLICFKTIDLEAIYEAIKREITKVKKNKNIDH